MNQQKLRYTSEDLIMYLEEKLDDDLTNDEEYELYLAYHMFGEEVFKSKIYQSIVHKLKKEIREFWR